MPGRPLTGGQSDGFETKGAGGVGNGQSGWVEQADLGENGCLVPVDVFKRDFSLFNPDKDHKCDNHLFPGGGDIGKHPFNRGGVGKGDAEFLDQLVFIHRLGNSLHFDVGRPKFSDEVVSVKIANRLPAFPAHAVGHVVKVWMVGHRGHGGLQITTEFGLHVPVEDSQNLFLFLGALGHGKTMGLSWIESIRIISSFVPSDKFQDPADLDLNHLMKS